MRGPGAVLAALAAASVPRPSAGGCGTHEVCSVLPGGAPMWSGKFSDPGAWEEEGTLRPLQRVERMGGFVANRSGSICGGFKVVDCDSYPEMTGKACLPGGASCALHDLCNETTGCCVPNPSNKTVYVELAKLESIAVPTPAPPPGPDPSAAPTGSPACANCSAAPTLSPSALPGSEDDDGSLPLGASIAIFFLTYFGLIAGLIFGLRFLRSKGYCKTGTMSDRMHDAKEKLLAT
eukprot:TRINITY_DN56524_c0_g1_i1.p1 TRINITY_DN56524_c0_g1~~TRINITY_DN56524_c0_g1_i1.p1  ORF type:complete len:235 (+),score=57.31 TRINITY_DN56524_c0_g1_i1:74-778(+)